MLHSLFTFIKPVVSKGYTRCENDYQYLFFITVFVTMAEDRLRTASYSIRVLLLLTRLSPFVDSGWACSLFTGLLILDNDSTFVIYLRIRNLWTHRAGCSMFTSIPLGESQKISETKHHKRGKGLIEKWCMSL